MSSFGLPVFFLPLLLLFCSICGRGSKRNQPNHTLEDACLLSITFTAAGPMQRKDRLHIMMINNKAMIVATQNQRRWGIVIIIIIISVPMKDQQHRSVVELQVDWGTKKIKMLCCINTARSAETLFIVSSPPATPTSLVFFSSSTSSCWLCIDYYVHERRQRTRCKVCSAPAPVYLAIDGAKDKHLELFAVHRRVMWSMIIICIYLTIYWPLGNDRWFICTTPDEGNNSSYFVSMM